MLVFMIIVTVLIGLAYADYCLIDNTAHFGICFGKLAEAEEARRAESSREADEAEAPTEEPRAPLEVLPVSASPAATRSHETGILVPPPRNPALVWRLLDLEPVLELREGWRGAAG